MRSERVDDVLNVVDVREDLGVAVGDVGVAPELWAEGGDAVLGPGAVDTRMKSADYKNKYTWLKW